MIYSTIFVCTMGNWERGKASYFTLLSSLPFSQLMFDYFFKHTLKVKICLFFIAASISNLNDLDLKNLYCVKTVNKLMSVECKKF